MQRLGLDNLPRVTNDEALELCAYHLKLAAIYFMNAPEDLDDVLGEAKRIILRDNPDYPEDPAWIGAEAFLRASHATHEGLAKEQAERFHEDAPAEPDETVRKYLDS